MMFLLVTIEGFIRVRRYKRIGTQFSFVEKKTKALTGYCTLNA